MSQLASLSGVTPLPEPLSQSEEYMEEFISQWCVGLSSVLLHELICWRSSVV